MTDEERKNKEMIVSQVRRQLCDMGVDSQIAFSIAVQDNLRDAILRDGADTWGKDVLRDFYLGRLRGTKNIGEISIKKLYAVLREYFAQSPEPAPPQPSPASKAEATVKPHGVSYSIHVDNVHNAVALSWIASVMNEQGVYDYALNSLAMIVDNITEQYSVDQSTPEADEDAILSMKRLIEKIRKANQ